MRKFFLSAGVLMVLALSAGSVSAAKLSDEDLKYCTSISEMAGTIMKNRQAEISMAKMMKATSGDAAMDNLGAVIIKDAYSRSAFRTEENQKRAISEFENEWFATCLKVKEK